MNFVFVMTDSQNTDCIGAYPNTHVNTPSTTRLAAEGVRFDRAHTACPLCTPARGSIFTGMIPAVNGARYNDATPYLDVPLMNELFAGNGYPVGYTGKWHLDGGFYNGYGKACGGFPQRWWYDGECYRRDIGDELYDMEEEPFEMCNRIDEPRVHAEAVELHDRLLACMQHNQAPDRARYWEQRPRR